MSGGNRISLDSSTHMIQYDKLLNRGRTHVEGKSGFKSNPHRMIGANEEEDEELK